MTRADRVNPLTYVRFTMKSRSAATRTTTVPVLSRDRRPAAGSRRGRAVPPKPITVVWPTLDEVRRRRRCPRATGSSSQASTRFAAGCDGGPELAVRRDQDDETRLASSLDGPSPRRSTVMRALSRATVTITEYQRDSSSKRPRSFVVSAARSRADAGGARRRRQRRQPARGIDERRGVDNRSFHNSASPAATAVCGTTSGRFVPARRPNRWCRSRRRGGVRARLTSRRSPCRAAAGPPWWPVRVRPEASFRPQQGGGPLAEWKVLRTRKRSYRAQAGGGVGDAIDPSCEPGPLARRPRPPGRLSKTGGRDG